MRVDGVLFLAHITTTLNAIGIERPRCIVRAEDWAWVGEHFPSLDVLVNPRPEEGMSSSLRIGCEAMREARGCFIVPVDHPQVAPETYRNLLEAFNRDGEAVCKPSFLEAHGHPVLIPQSVIRGFLEVPLETPLSEVIRASMVRQTILHCEDPAVVQNLNSPADLAAIGQPARVGSDRKGTGADDAI